MSTKTINYIVEVHTKRSNKFSAIVVNSVQYIQNIAIKIRKFKEMRPFVFFWWQEKFQAPLKLNWELFREATLKRLPISGYRGTSL